MIYLIGGAPRAGKSTLAQQFAANQRIGWITTDLLVDILRVQDESLQEAEWNATPEGITASAEWFFPYLERFVWGVNSHAEHYVIDGVGFLPSHIKQVAAQYPLRTVFLGCSQMTLEKLDNFPGCSHGYSKLPEAMRRQIAKDVPLWSEFIRQECEKFEQPYIDTAKDFAGSLSHAESILTGLA